jgi:hypothetical protein
MVRRVGVVLAAVVVASLGAAGPSAADPPGIVKAADTTGATSFDKSLTVLCPGGTVVSGGGGYVPAPENADVQGFVGLDRLEPLGNGSGFIARMREFQSTIDLWKLSVDAICVTEPAGYEVKAFPAPVETQVATGSCEAKNLIGVGGRINNGGGDVVLDFVAPSANLKGVTVRGTPIPGRNPVGWSVTAFAVCADVFGLERIMFADPLSGNAHKGVNQSCPAGKGLYSPSAAISPGSGRVYLSLVHAISIHQMSATADEAAGDNPPNWALLGYGICG